MSRPLSTKHHSSKRFCILPFCTHRSYTNCFFMILTALRHFNTKAESRPCCYSLEPLQPCICRTYNFVSPIAAPLTYSLHSLVSHQRGKQYPSIEPVFSQKYSVVSRDFCLSRALPNEFQKQSCSSFLFKHYTIIMHLTQLLCNPITYSKVHFSSFGRRLVPDTRPFPSFPQRRVGCSGLCKSPSTIYSLKFKSCLISLSDPLTDLCLAWRPDIRS